MELPKIDIKKILFATDLSENSLYAFAHAIKDALAKYCDGARECLLDRSFVTDEIIVGRGDPAKQILKYAEDKYCDLIVVGSHGQGSLTGAMMGSTAKRVLKKSKVPVLVVQQHEDK